MEYKNTIYKFRTWSTEDHKACLLKNQPFFSSHDKLNDPFDFKIETDFSLLDNDGKKLEYIDLAIRSYSLDQLLKLGNIECFRSKMLDLLKTNPERFQAEYDLKENERSNNRFGILCFSLTWSNILLWTHYANNSSGFCIGLNRSKIEQAKIGMSGLVKYTDDYPIIDPLNTNHLETIVTRLHFKGAAWSYEEEYRISIIRDYILSIKDRQYEFPNDYLSEIILGLNISDRDQGEIVELAKMKQVPVFKIVKRAKSFELDRQLLS
jgi:hypothetical protein